MKFLILLITLIIPLQACATEYSFEYYPETNSLRERSCNIIEKCNRFRCWEEEYCTYTTRRRNDYNSDNRRRKYQHYNHRHRYDN
jgi:hypothetical protein